MATEDKVVLTCAVTGVLANRAQCEAIPYTPAEIADECKRAYDAGASVVHIHGRTDSGGPSWELDTFMQIKEEVRSRCPIILNFSTGNLTDDVSEQVEIIKKVRPEIAALNMGTMNYGKYSKKRKSFVFEMIFPNRYGKIMELLEAMNEVGVKPELECFDSGHTHGSWPLLDMGLLPKPAQYSFVMNVLGGIPPTVEGLQLQQKTLANLLPEESCWEVIGISHGHWKMLATALVLGGNIRTGLEDHLYLPNGEMAKSNGELVDQAASLARITGREPATVEEARKILGLEHFAAGRDAAEAVGHSSGAS